MNVKWDKRAQAKHHQRARVAVVKARLTDRTLSPTVIAVPVVTEAQVNDLAALLARFEDLRHILDESLEELIHAMQILRGENHPDGWAEVRIAEGQSDAVVATVKHHTPAVPDEDNHRTRRLKRLKADRAMRGMRTWDLQRIVALRRRKR